MINKLKDKIVLSDELGKYISIKKKGDLYWGRCPFHDEETPSFVINNEKKFYYCFGCGEHGDIFAFYKKYLNKTFQETLKELGDLYDMKINLKKVTYDYNCEKILQEALIHYKENLKYNQIALDYLKKRNISEEYIDKFQIGFSNKSDVIDMLINKGHKIDSIKKSGLNSYGGLDRFRDRIIFPIFSKNNQIIGFAGRVLDKSEPKYLNSPETDLFQKNLHLFNENNLIPKEPIILVEGYIDVISMTQQGIKNVVASMGTSLSAGQALSIFRNSDILYIMLDGDSSGQNATERDINICLKVLTPDKQIFICNLNPDQDPDNLAQNGPIIIENVLKNSKNFLEWKWEKLIKKFDNSTNSLAKLFDNIEEFLLNVQNKNLKKAYKTFFDERVFHMKKNHQNIKNPEAVINSEDIIIIIIIKLPELIDNVIEDLMICKFANKNYEKIKNDIIEKITIESLNNINTIEFISLKYNKILQNLFTKNNFSYIINNRDFALQYLMDTICILKRNNASSLE